MFPVSLSVNTMSNKNPKRPEPSKLYNYILHTREVVEIRLSNLLKHPSPLQKFSEESALQWLKTQIEQQRGLDQRGFIIEEKDGSKWVRVWMNIRLCLDYGRLDGFCRNQKKCKFWHVCKEFLEGNCVDASKCSLSHHFLDKHNEKIAVELGISKLSPSNIFKVVVANLPVLCQKYIESECENSDPSCHKVHLCPHHVENARHHGNCHLSHDENSTRNQNAFKNFNLPEGEELFYHILLPKYKKASCRPALQTRDNSLDSLAASAERLISLNLPSHITISGENPGHSSYFPNEETAHDGSDFQICDQNKSGFADNFSAELHSKPNDLSVVGLDDKKDAAFSVTNFEFPRPTVSDVGSGETKLRARGHAQIPNDDYTLNIIPVLEPTGSSTGRQTRIESDGEEEDTSLYLSDRPESSPSLTVCHRHERTLQVANRVQEYFGNVFWIVIHVVIIVFCYQLQKMKKLNRWLRNSLRKNFQGSDTHPM